MGHPSGKAPASGEGGQPRLTYSGSGRGRPQAARALRLSAETADGDAAPDHMHTDAGSCRTARGAQGCPRGEEMMGRSTEKEAANQLFTLWGN